TAKSKIACLKLVRGKVLALNRKMARYFRTKPGSVVANAWSLGMRQTPWGVINPNSVNCPRNVSQRTDMIRARI
ncbi:hypothetical protein ABTM45_19520, partial [Acinetobacter baumannii]